MDNKKFIGWQDRIKVDVNDPSEVEYFHSKHSLLSHQEIKDALKFAGPYRQKVHDFLTRKVMFKNHPFNGFGLFGGLTTSLLAPPPTKKVKIRVNKKQ